MARIIGIRPERGRDGRTERTGRTDGRTDGTDGRADGRHGRTGGRTGRTDGIQFDSTTGTEKYSVTVLLSIHVLGSKLYFSYCITYLVVST